ncbi:MAG: TIGR03905 family TSCPD domain-containing protein [Bacilli bacterium]|nr:TIGR03905 family TSCPD domain-containing protein [Bacilli bacterium]
MILKKFSFTPKGVCSSKMNIVIDKGIIKDIEIIGGCPGNTLGISKLCIGKNVKDVIELLSGIDCRGRGTSCPDQLAKALEKALIVNK